MNYRMALNDLPPGEYHMSDKLAMMIEDQAEDENAMSPLDCLIALEDELGCSIVEALNRERSRQRVVRRQERKG